MHFLKIKHSIKYNYLIRYIFQKVNTKNRKCELNTYLKMQILYYKVHIYSVITNRLIFPSRMLMIIFFSNFSKDILNSII